MALAYYNEHDPYCAAWLRNLIAAGYIAHGVVDERSIVDVQPAELAAFTQCHFFAGLGGWSFAARLAGWPDDRPLWTGSCPCQSFSRANPDAKRFKDNRHLWPEWFRIIRKRQPAVIFGEQVTGTPEWLALVRSDLEAVDYAVGGLPIEAASAGARHWRDRYYYVADSDKARWSDSQRSATRATQSKFRQTPSVVYSAAFESFYRTFKPDQSWIDDGISNRGHAVRALGNAIVPQVAAEFIGAWLDAG